MERKRLLMKKRPRHKFIGDIPTKSYYMNGATPIKQMGGSISELGYSKDSPYKHNPYLDIYTSDGSITMQNTEFPLLGIDELGNSQIMHPGNDYQFPGKKVREIPMMQRGGSRLDVYKFLNEGDDDDEEDAVKDNTAPSTEEVEQVVQEDVPEEDDMTAMNIVMASMGEIPKQKGFAGQYGHQIISELRAALGYTPNFNSVGRTQEQQNRLIQQGFGVKNSWHLTGDAVDMKPEDWNNLPKEKQAYFRGNYDVVNHNNHYHIEPKGPH